MSMIQVRNVPDRLHRELAKRAKRRGVTLTRYIQDILEREVARPPADEVFNLVDASPAVQLGRPAAALVREERADRKQP
jgi:plasmid stability protein